MSIFKRLFGSEYFTKYIPFKSPFSNFLRTCSLPFYCKDSPETTELKNTLRSLQFNFIANDQELNEYRLEKRSSYSLKNKIFSEDMTPTKLNNDITNLLAAKTAVQKWIDIRSKSTPERRASHRLPLIKKFLGHLITLENSINELVVYKRNTDNINTANPLAKMDTRNDSEHSQLPPGRNTPSNPITNHISLYLSVKA